MLVLVLHDVLEGLEEEEGEGVLGRPQLPLLFGKESTDGTTVVVAEGPSREGLVQDAVDLL